MTVAGSVRRLAREELGREVDIELVDNPRSETLVEEFTVDTSSARDRLGWQPEHTVEGSIRHLLKANAEAIATPQDTTDKLPI